MWCTGRTATICVGFTIGHVGAIVGPAKAGLANSVAPLQSAAEHGAWLRGMSRTTAPDGRRQGSRLWRGLKPNRDASEPPSDSLFRDLISVG
jgi:hypothetical protein